MSYRPDRCPFAHQYSLSLCATGDCIVHTCTRFPTCGHGSRGSKCSEMVWIASVQLSPPGILQEILAPTSWLQNQDIAFSRVLKQSFYKNDKRYHLILHPKTCRRIVEVSYRFSIELSLKKLRNLRRPERALDPRMFYPYFISFLSKRSENSIFPLFAFPLLFCWFFSWPVSCLWSRWVCSYWEDYCSLHTFLYIRPLPHTSKRKKRRPCLLTRPPFRRVDG